MEFIGGVVALALLSVPVLLIVILVKVSGLEKQIAALMKNPGEADQPRPECATVENSKDNLDNKEQQENIVPSCSSCLLNT